MQAKKKKRNEENQMTRTFNAVLNLWLQIHNHLGLNLNFITLGGMSLFWNIDE